MLITNFKKYIVILDATTKYRDMYFVEWAEKPAAHDMVKKFVSGIPNTHCGMGLSQTCAKVPKRFEFLGSLSPRSETLMDLGPCTSCRGTLSKLWPQDPGNPGPQNFDSRKTLETQDLKIWICGETLETQDPEPPNFDASRLKRPWSLHHSMQNFMLSIVPGSSTSDELGRS